MNRSESIIKLSQALLKAQKDMESAKKDSANPFFKSKYADYNAVLEACKGPLNNNGILILQPTSIIDGTVVIETVLIHSDSGEFISATTPIVVAKQNDPQALGSAVTYGKRYGLQSLISLPSEDDDSELAMGRGNKLQGREPTKSVTQPTSQVKPPVTAQKVEPEVKAEAPARRRVAMSTEAVKPTETKVEPPTGKTENNDQW